MARDPTPEFSVPSRDEIRDRYVRDYKIRLPSADTSPGTQPFLDASTLADQMTGLYAIAARAAERGLIRRSTGAFLDEIGLSLETPRRLAAGASGFVIVDTSRGGATVFAGDEIRSKARLRYVVARTMNVASGDLVPVAGVDTGAATNLDPGEVMTFSSGRPGLSPRAVVALSAGAGLTGGTADETDEAYQARLLTARRARIQTGNEDAYIDVVEKTPGVGVEKAFVYPAVLGPGTTGIAFTVASNGTPGASRRPSAEQIVLVRQELAIHFPGDDQIFVAHVASQSARLAFAVRLADRTRGFTDAAPWPLFFPRSAASGPGAVVVAASPAPTATAFTLASSNGAYGVLSGPSPGQTIAFYNAASASFAAKRIATVAGNGPWAITVDTTNSASDTLYAPAPGQRAMPFAAALDKLAAPVAAFLAQMGPGEMVPGAPRSGLRQARVPDAAEAYPEVLDNRVLAAILALPEARSVRALEGTDDVPPLPAPGTLTWLLELTDLAFFPDT